MEEQTQKKLKMIQGATTFSLIIPEAVEAKIRHLCSKVEDIEWSGTLFYKVEGSFDDGTFKATCLDICVMDIGSQGFTNFLDTSDIISYRIDHPELLQPGVYEGLIHSHNRMSAFFSGTDTDTLNSEGTDLNHFLSLIVNNEGKYVARVTRKLSKKVVAEAHIVYTESSSYHTYENREIVLDSNKRTESDRKEEKEETVVEWFELKIDKHDVPQPFEEVDKRLQEIRTKKASTRYGGNYGYNYYGGGYAPQTSENFGGKKETKAKEDKKGKSAPAKVVNTPEKNKLVLVKPEEPKPKVQTPEPKKFVKEPTLFSDLEGDECNLPLCLEQSADNDVIEHLCIQLLCGSVLITNSGKINLEEWVKKMDSLYEKRFGSLDDECNYDTLSKWIEQLVELLITTHPDMDLETRVGASYPDCDETDCVQVYAFDMIRFLDDLPESSVKDMMIDELYTYLPNGIEDYI